MSLIEKWEEHRQRWYMNAPDPFVKAAQRAFYAGAEADCQEDNKCIPLSERQAEIDRFKGTK